MLHRCNNTHVRVKHCLRHTGVNLSLPYADEVVPAKLDLTNAVMLGRQDFTVRSIDAALGQEKWNVTFAQIDVLTPPRLAAGNAANDHLLPPLYLTNAGRLSCDVAPGAAGNIVLKSWLYKIYMCCAFIHAVHAVLMHKTTL